MKSLVQADKSVEVCAEDEIIADDSQAATVTDVVEHLWQVRPSIIVRPEVRSALQTFAQTANLHL